MDYKETLHMPKTAFEMRGKLPTKEPGIQKRWQDQKLYEKMLEKRKDAQSFVLHDGPPYANGDIHLGRIFQDGIRMDFRSKQRLPNWDTIVRKSGLPSSVKFVMTLRWNRWKNKRKVFWL